jgi:N-acetylmuramoyl-L-alanine amidase
MIQKAFLYTSLFLMILSSFNYAHGQLFTIMINPSGDAENTGRKIDDSFERGITLQCTERLKKLIEEAYPAVRVVLTRFPGETLQPLQNANFANRLDVDFYLSIHFYEEQEVKPSLALYTFLSDNNLIPKPVDLAFYAHDKAYVISHATTHEYSRLMHSIFIQEKYHHQFNVKDLYALPFAPLIGIKSPAIALEIGLKTKESWTHFLAPILESIEAVIRKKAII